MDYRDFSNPLYESPIYIAVTEFLSQTNWFAYANWLTVAITTIIFFVYCFSKEGRDERGRGIIGTACLYGLIAFVILVNIFTYYTYTVISHPYLFANGLRLVYNGFMLTILISIAILRKIR